MSEAQLTCHLAGEIAKSDLPNKFLRLEIEMIKGFTPRHSPKTGSWSAVLLNYYFALAMTKLNPAIAVCLMAEAGVDDDSIETALQRAAIPKKGGEYQVKDTHVAIAPPTFSDNVEDWAKRGYEVDRDLKLGDVCVYDGLVGLYRYTDDTGISIMAGFVPGSGGIAVPDERLIKVIRV